MTSHTETVLALREHIAIRDETIRQLQAVLVPHEDFSALGYLSPSEVTILSVVLRWEIATVEQINQALYGARSSDWPGGNGIRVFAHRLRCKLATHRICLWSVRGRGYRIPPEHKSTLRSLIDRAATPKEETR